MSKKKSIQNREILQRANFLHQAAMAMANINPTLSSYYGNTMKSIQKKGVMKIDPSIKRDLCKRCSIGFTSDTAIIEAVENNDELVFIVCKQCGYRKKYPVNDYYKLWSEKQEAMVESIEIDRN